MQLSLMVLFARYLMTKEPGKYKIVEGTDYGVDNFAVGSAKMIPHYVIKSMVS